jgi:hypothetical protein
MGTDLTNSLGVPEGSTMVACLSEEKLLALRQDGLTWLTCSADPTHRAPSIPFHSLFPVYVTHLERSFWVVGVVER